MAARPPQVPLCRRIVVEVTGRCPNACLHCYNPWPRNPARQPSARELSRSDVLGIVRRVRRDVPLEQVVLSGGEPMLRSDLSDIVCDLADEGLDCAVITSGVLLGTERLRRFPEDTLFEVTLLGGDRLSHDRLVGREAFDKVLRGLLALRRHRCRFVLVVVVTAQNAHDVGRILRAGLAMGAEAVLLNRVNLARRSLSSAAALVPAPDALRSALAAADDVAARYGIGISVSVPVPPCVVDPRDFAHLHFGWCPRGSEEAYYTVAPTGLLRPCNHSARVLGDVRRTPFGALVTSQVARTLWAGTPEPCRRCTHPLAGVCRGGCPAAADECHGSPGLIDPFVAASIGRAREDLGRGGANDEADRARGRRTMSVLEV